MPASIDDAEIDVVLSLPAGESSNSTQAEPIDITNGQELGEVVKACPKAPAQSVRAE
jgi:hypothetical protein